MKINIRFFGAMLSLLMLFSCDNYWDNHYQGGEDQQHETLLDIIKNDSKYSEFYSALLSVGLDKELEKRQVMTLWAPNNSAMDNLPDDDDAKKQMLLYHINIGSIYSHMFQEIIDDGGRLRTLNGKYLKMEMDAIEDVVTINGASILSTDVISGNGIVHEIGELLVAKSNIYEYAVSLSDEYSYVRDFILQNNYFIPDLENSRPVGVDDFGKTVYDTVWIKRNDFLENGDVNDEAELFSAFLSTNGVIDEAVSNAQTLYTSLTNMPMSDELESQVKVWCVTSIFSEQVYDTYPAEASMLLTNNKVWISSKEEVNPVPITLSNGYVFEVTKLNVPKYLFLPSLRTDPEIYFDLNEEDQANYYELWSRDGYKTPSLTDGITFFVSNSDSKDPSAELYVKWDAVKIMENNEVITSKIAPGEYKVLVSLRTHYGPEYVKLSINDVVVNDKISANVVDSNDKYRIREAGIVRFGDEITGKPVSIKIEHVAQNVLSGTERARISVDYVELIPVMSDYNY